MLNTTGLCKCCLFPAYRISYVARYALSNPTSNVQWIVSLDPLESTRQCSVRIQLGEQPQHFPSFWRCWYLDPRKSCSTTYKQGPAGERHLYGTAQRNHFVRIQGRSPSYAPYWGISFPVNRSRTLPTFVDDYDVCGIEERGTWCEETRSHQFLRTFW